MGWFTAVVLYFLIWWIVLFAVLPIGTRPDAEPDAASGWRGTPVKPRLGRKLIATSLVAAVVWGGCVALVESNWLSFRHGWLALHDE
jgi:predicted secreted protein